MSLLECEVAQQMYEERLRKAQQKQRPLVLVNDAAGTAPVEGANGLWDQIKQWLRGRKQHQQGSDVRSPRTV